MVTPDLNTGPFLEAMKRITAFEEAGPVTQWRYRGFHVWPIVKYVLVKQLIAAMARGYVPTDRFKTYPAFATKMKRAVGVTSVFSKGADVSASIEVLPGGVLQEHSVWCFGSGSGFQHLNGVLVSQHHHALRAAISDRGHRSLGLYSGFDATTAGAQPDYGPQVSLDPYIQSVGRTALVPALTAAFLRKNFPAVDGVIATTGHPAEDLFAFADTLIGRVAYAIDCFDGLFRKAPPEAVFSSNYASFYGWALAHLCRRDQVPFVDIQHGLQGRFNGAYHFATTPEQDWSVFPTAQLCWSLSDATAFTAPNAMRRAAVVGPTWTQFARFAPDRQAPRVAALRQARVGNGPLVLFAGQQADDILVAKRARDMGLNVLFRGHPMRQRQSEQLVSPDDVAALGCRLATETPLPTLLDHVDGVMTGYSAVILEACLKGVPCLATGAFATLLPKDYDAELNNLLTVQPLMDPGEKARAALAWASGLTKEGLWQPQQVATMSEALDLIGIAH